MTKSSFSSGISIVSEAFGCVPEYAHTSSLASVLCAQTQRRRPGTYLGMRVDIQRFAVVLACIVAASIRFADGCNTCELCSNTV